MSDSPTARLVEREIPIPALISQAAQERLAQTIAITAQGGAPMPALDDIAAWEAMAEMVNGSLLAMIEQPNPATVVTPMVLGGVPAYDIVPHNRSTDFVCVYLHGGALVYGAGPVGCAMSAAFAEGAQMRTIGVDYRMPPHHPYPAPLDDCVAAYRALLETHDPGKVVVGGQSAGGNLAPALVLRARDEGLPMPAAVLLLTPEADLTESGDTFETLLGVDAVQGRLPEVNQLYAGGHDLADHYISPLFGDFSKGFPPTFLQSGTRDIFLSNTVRFHRALRQCGIAADLNVYEAMPHGGFGAILEGGLGQSPEDQEVYEAVRRFLAELK